MLLTREEVALENLRYVAKALALFLEKIGHDPEAFQMAALSVVRETFQASKLDVDIRVQEENGRWRHWPFERGIEEKRPHESNS